MFIKKTHIDVKKLTSKIQDSKKDTASRLRHLKTILGKKMTNSFLFYSLNSFSQTSQTKKKKKFLFFE